MSKQKTKEPGVVWDFNGVRTEMDFFDSVFYQKVMTGLKSIGDETKGVHTVDRYRAFFDDIFGDGYGEKLISARDTMLALDCMASFLDFSFDRMMKVPELMNRLGAVERKADQIIKMLEPEG